MINLFECVSLSSRGKIYGFQYFKYLDQFVFLDFPYHKVYLCRSKQVSKSMLRTKDLKTVPISEEGIVIRLYILRLCMTLLDNMTDNTLPDA